MEIHASRRAVGGEILESSVYSGDGRFIRSLVVIVERKETDL